MLIQQYVSSSIVWNLCNFTTVALLLVLVLLKERLSCPLLYIIHSSNYFTGMWCMLTLDSVSEVGHFDSLPHLLS